MIGKEKWMYEVRVKKGRVCEKCVERCWIEVEAQERRESERETEGENDKRRDSFLMGEERELRKIQSQGHLKGEVGESVDGEVMSDLRKVRSDLQLQRVGTASVDEILSRKAKEPLV
jgi:hypothetical protein